MSPGGRKKRFPYQVCKPCWELKYCPYGPLVEFFPLNPEKVPLTKVRSNFRQIVKRAAAGEYRTAKDVRKLVRSALFWEPSFWERLAPYQTGELGCNVFGHVCPVFLMEEPFTETQGFRRSGRAVPRDVMLKVVRRDNQTCQVCGKLVPDTEIEFDHIIPHSKGGPLTVENLRVLCRDCNRKKSDALDELLQGPK